MSTLHQQLVSLYRSLLRETRVLPTPYLRLFFRIKFRDDLETALHRRTKLSMQKRIKKLTKDLSKLRGANSGRHNAFHRILDLAYGRKGKLWWEIMEPLTAKPQSTNLQPPIIPNVEKSRPPAYSPALTALLLSSISRSTKPLTPQHLRVPPSLPERVDPASQEAQLLGPLSKRREVNTRWRFFSNECRKVIPPLEVESISTSTDELANSGSGLSSMTPLQDAGLMLQLHNMAGQVGKCGTKTRRERLSDLHSKVGLTDNEAHQDATRVLPTRFLRRSHQALLGRIPRLTRISAGESAEKYTVSVSSSAITPRTRFPPHRLADVDSANAAWLGASIAQSTIPHIGNKP